jgi:hypothetical protein
MFHILLLNLRGNDGTDHKAKGTELPLRLYRTNVMLTNNRDIRFEKLSMYLALLQSFGAIS